MEEDYFVNKKKIIEKWFSSFLVLAEKFSGEPTIRKLIMVECIITSIIVSNGFHLKFPVQYRIKTFTFVKVKEYITDGTVQHFFPVTAKPKS